MIAASRKVTRQFSCPQNGLPFSQIKTMLNNASAQADWTVIQAHKNPRQRTSCALSGIV
ncbi:MAG: hypothetical protein ABIG45_04940 [Bacillota bacterium]